MIAKLFEVRDRGTFIPAIGIKLEPKHPQELFLYRRAGYVFDEHYVLFSRIDGQSPLNYDIYGWTNRTMQVAHDHVIKNWDKLVSGDVIDVQFILGETPQPKESEFLPVAKQKRPEFSGPKLS